MKYVIMDSCDRSVLGIITIPQKHKGRFFYVVEKIKREKAADWILDDILKGLEEEDVWYLFDRSVNVCWV